MIFKHKYARSGLIKLVRHPRGGLVPHTLVVEACIPLVKGSPNYIESHVAELEKAAVDYAKLHGCEKIEFLSVN